MNKAIIAIVILFIVAGCHIIEVNMVQRANLDKGDGTVSSMKEITSKKESDKLELIVPIK